MKRFLTVSVLFSLMLCTASASFAHYTNNEETETLIRQHRNEHIQENDAAWTQTINSYEASYNDSMRKYWDAYTEAYQKQKKIQH